MANDLHPDHLADLIKSGLNLETIQVTRIYSARPGDISQKLNGGFPKVTSLLCFPYPGTNGYERFKLFPPQNTDKGTVKYYQKARTPPRLYVPPKTEAVLQDSSIPIFLTEGEKKTLKADQEGIPCIGLGGLWNWSDGTPDKNLISDFDKVNLKDRTIVLVPDNDYRNPNRHGERKNLPQAVDELAFRLIDRGARVFVLKLPQGPKKVGLDDFLCHHPVEEFHALPRKEIRKQTLDEMVEGASLETAQEIIKRLAGQKEVEKAVHINNLAKKLNIPKSAIKKDVKRAEPSRGLENKISPLAYFPELVDLVVDKRGEILFLVYKGGKFEAVSVYENAGYLYGPPETRKIPFSIPRAAEVERWISSDTPERLFNDLLCHLKRFSYLPEHQFIIVACFTFLTYIQDHPGIHYFPMLLFWSAPERGKTRTGRAITSCAFRGLHMVDLREPNLFRYSQDHRATIFIDVMNLWDKTKKAGSEDVLLLRYEKGAKVARVIYPEKGPFNDTVYYDVYGPTIIATNEPVHHILDTRCIPIAMQNKPGTYENPKGEKSLEMRERLTAWRARAINSPLPNVEEIPGITGRLWDIAKPLFQVCQMVAPSHIGTLQNAILEMAGQRIEENQDSLDGQIAGALKDLSPDGLPEWETGIQEIVDKLNKNRPEDHQLTPRYVGQRIKGLSLPKRKAHGVYVVSLTRTTLKTLLVQYGYEKIISEDAPPNMSPTSPTSPNEIDSNTYRGDIGGDIRGHCLKGPPKRPLQQGELFPQVKDIGDIGDVQRGADTDNLREGII